jgi:hypothetical protein
MKVAAEPQHLAVACPHCGQRPGQRCVSRSVGAAATHAARKAAAQRPGATP